MSLLQNAQYVSKKHEVWCEFNGGLAPTRRSCNKNNNKFDSSTISNSIAQNVIYANNKTNVPQIRHYLPLHIRQNNYERVRKMIFDDEKNVKPISKRILKIRQKFRESKKFKRCVIESVYRANRIKPDPRI